MFGYVRPYKNELKVGEYELFKAAYCGLCGALKKRYGLAGRFILTYDFVFLAMLLSSADKSCSFCYKRCVASPFRKKRCCEITESFAVCADYSVILTWWKLRDSVADGGFAERIKAGAAMAALSRAYKKARRAAPEFDRVTAEAIAGLSQLEAERCASLDRAADRFAEILAAAAGSPGGTDRRVLEQLLYHTGRAVYILDAVDDLDEDAKRGTYNAVAERFGTEDGRLGAGDREYLHTTLKNSFSIIAAAFELLPSGIWTPLIANTIYLGLPWVCDLVLNGEWKARSASMHRGTYAAERDILNKSTNGANR